MNDTLCQVLRLFPLQEETLAAAVAAEHHIVHNVHIAHKTHTQPVLRHEGKPDTQLPDLHRCLVAQVVNLTGFGVVIENFALGQLLQTGNGLQQLPLSGTGNAGNTQNFTAAGGKGNIVQNGCALAVDTTDVLHLQTVLRVFRLTAVDVELHFLAHHHFGQLAFIGFCGVDCADIFALSQNGDPIRKAQHFVELMGDNDDTFAVIPHTPQNSKQLLGFLGG